ncbi:MAG TPA: hypothetical protein GX736_04220 [Mogibacterium sp.]|nr:hypothetical protein [Mogibacterium sp.]
MRSNRDKRTDSEREIDDFLSQFESPVDDLSADVNSYLSDDLSSTKRIAEMTFYGNDYKKYTESPHTQFSDSTEKNSSYPVNSNANKDSTLSSKSKESSNKLSAKLESIKESSSASALSDKIKSIDKAQLKSKLFLKDNPDYDPTKGETYILNGKKIKNKPQILSAKKIIRDVIGLGLIIFLCGMLYALVCITLAPKVNPNDLYSYIDTSSIVYDDDGKQVDSVFYTQNRKIIKYEEMPEDLINSFVAIEDKTFWKHHGFNWTRMIGAILSSLTGRGRISGTSTITQQLARNVYLSDIKSQRSIRRKILEMYYASRIEASLEKKEIVEAYLNTIYLGFGCYGVDAAAKVYFSCDVKDLTLVQCASLAALPPAPDSYALLKFADATTQVGDDSKIVQREPDTVITNDIARDRRNLTLDLMLEQNMITQEKHDKSYDKPLTSFLKPKIISGYGSNSYFHEYLVETIINDLMEEYNMTYADAERMVHTKGLKIYSTMDSKAQKTVVDAFKNDDNFPSVSGMYYQDSEGNILNSDGQLALYNYNKDFSKNGDFTIPSKDVVFNNDGSVTIKKGRMLNIYETEVEGQTDYSLEFKVYYRIIDNKLYSIQGGYINVPSNYKSLDSKGNLVISPEYFTEYQGDMKKDGGKLIITKKAYSLANKTLQPQAAMAIVGVGTGEIKALVGGRTFRGQKLLNRALNPRQPGSAIKPLAVYGAALQKSYELAEKGEKWKYTDFHIDKQGIKGWGDYVTTHSSIEDEKTRINGKYWPKNVTHSFSGKNNFVSAVQKSINTCAVKLQLQVGDDFSIKQLKRFGITTVVDDPNEPVNDINPAALALGAMTQGVTPLEMACAYASFPAGGKLNSPICYTKVLDRDGNVILTGKSETSEALNEGVAWIMTNVLKSVVRANGYMYVEGVQPGGKTGTTNDQYDIWFSGFTPKYAATLWIGTDNNVALSSMSYAAASLWGKIINNIPKAKKGEYLPQPANVIYKAGHYFTRGTETGLAKYVGEDEIKKLRDKAYKEWLKERENHKIWIVDKPGYFETQTIEHEGIPPEYDEEGNLINEPKDPWTETIEVWIEEVGHWEYEVGWRDGDFKFEYEGKVYH